MVSNQPIRSIYHFILYNIFYRHALRHRVKTRLNGFQLVIEPSVMHPKFFKSGKIFAEFLKKIDFDGKHVIDMGTGSGLLALIAASRGARGIAIDKNPTAVRCAHENIAQNGFGSQISVVEGDLFSPIGEERYDFILFNPPYLVKEQHASYDTALFAGENLSLIETFATSARCYLKPAGCILLILSSDADVERCLNIFQTAGFKGNLLRRKTTLFEEFYIYQFVFSPDSYPTLLTTLSSGMSFVCPSCRKLMEQRDRQWLCTNESYQFGYTNGIPDFILPSRRNRTERFLQIYNTVRKSEMWGSHDVEYYRSLPYRDTTGKYNDIWRVRSKSYDSFLKDLRQEPKPPGKILDLGAGNCWLSYRLAQAGHQVVAVDVNTDILDGLGAAQRLRENQAITFECVRAEFEYLPFPERTFDVIVFNASLHYATDPYELIQNMLHFLKNDGTIYVLDSPIYRNPASGVAMVEERIKEFKLKFSFNVPQEFTGSFLTYDRLEELRNRCSVQFIQPRYGFKWDLRRYLASSLRRREPASFEIIKIQKHH